MLLSHENRLSARICGHVLNYPLYDGDCSPAAREYLAAGNVEGAISEWQRLADLGSGRTRCVLAYLRFRGTPSTLADVMQAKRIALSAVAGERGYANYLLGCFALSELQMGAAVKYFIDSHKAGFTPAQTAMASLLRHVGGSAIRSERRIFMAACHLQSLETLGIRRDIVCGNGDGRNERHWHLDISTRLFERRMDCSLSIHRILFGRRMGIGRYAVVAPISPASPEV
jgi:hypothetical protein